MRVFSILAMVLMLGGCCAISGGSSFTPPLCVPSLNPADCLCLASPHRPDLPATRVNEAAVAAATAADQRF